MGFFGYIVQIRFVAYAALGAVCGLFVGALPGLSVTMATALLVSLTYTWETEYALATVMGIYVIGVFSGALSAILLNIPGAPSSVITTLDGYPMACRGRGERAIRLAAVYSVMGSSVGLLALWLLARPVTKLALLFTPMDTFLLCLFGLLSIGALTAEDALKGWACSVFGLLLGMVGMDPVAGYPRLTFGIKALRTGISTVPALIGLFGFAQVLAMTADAVSKKMNRKNPLPQRMNLLLQKTRITPRAVCCVIGPSACWLP